MKIDMRKDIVELKGVNVGDVILAKNKDSSLELPYVIIVGKFEEILIVSLFSFKTVCVFEDLETLRREFEEFGEFNNIFTETISTLVEVIPHQNIVLRRD